MNQAFQVIKRAPRSQDGRVIGVAPPVLMPRIIKVLSPADMSKLRDLQMKRAALSLEMRKFLESVGLPATGGITYVFHRDGEVTVRGTRKPLYE